MILEEGFRGGHEKKGNNRKEDGEMKRTNLRMEEREREI